MPEATLPVRPIRSLLRGLEVLAALAEGEGLTVTQAARAVRLPRTTTYRVLETLRNGGYVQRDEMDRYRQTGKSQSVVLVPTPQTGAPNA
jgi:DNA-binding IclR family transcriptional regulator